MRIGSNENSAAHNTCLAKIAVQCSADSFVVNHPPKLDSTTTAARPVAEIKYCGTGKMNLFGKNIELPSPELKREND